MQLCLVQRNERIDCFDLHDDLILNQQVDSVATIDVHAVINDGQVNFPQRPQSAPVEFEQ